MADIDNVTVGENNYNLRDSAAQNALPTQGQVDDIITALNTIADKTDHPYNPDNKLPSDYVNDANQTHKFATQAQLTQIETNKTNILLSLDANGAKNLLDYSIDTLKADANNVGGIYDFSWNGNVCTSTKGVTLTVNSDNSISVVASSATYDVWFRLKRSFTYEAGNTYILSGCPSGGSTSTYYLESDNLNLRDTGDTTTISQSSAYTDDIYLVIKTGTTYSGTFKPMICEKSLWDISHKYEPYALPNTTLTPALVECVDNGAKNKLNITSVDMSWATINADKSITVNLTTSSSNQFVHIGFNNLSTTAYVPTPQDFGGCMFSGNSSTVSGVSLIMEFSNNGSSWVDQVAIGAQTDKARELPSTYPYCRLALKFNANAPSGTYTFKPMICSQAEWKASPTYHPYAMSNAELTEATQQNESNIALRPQVLVRSVTNITSTTTLDDTGVSYTIPSNAYVRITATARYGQSNPEEIMIWTGSSVFAHTVAITGDNNFSLTATTLIGGISGDTTAKIYARFRGANTNAIILEVESVPNPS